MFHIDPIPPEKASKHVHTLYEDICKTLEIESIPLVFQYIANYEIYCDFLWQQCKANIQAPIFEHYLKDTVKTVRKAVTSIYHPSQKIQQYVAKLSEHDREDLLHLILSLFLVNTKLMILSTGIRESVKGVSVISKQKMAYSQLEEQVVEAKSHSSRLKDYTNTITKSSHLLTPLFGEKIGKQTQYADFFTMITEEMDAVLASEIYLKKRVTLEQQTMKQTEELPYALGCSYGELMDMVRGKPYIDELIYLLSETFPTQFPRLVLTSAIMEYVLVKHIELITQS